MKGKIIYIDEDPEDIIYFQDFIDGHFDLEVIEITNGVLLNDVVDEILSSPPDAIITDFLLNEKARVSFNGQALIESIQHRNKHIPCFLLTSHAPDALTATHDARLVQSKAVLLGGNSISDLKSLFRIQIAKVIETYKESYRKAVDEIDALSAETPQNLTAIQRQRLVELDDYIESFGLSSHQVPSALKEDKSIELLTQLISSVDDLIARTKK